MSRDHVIRTLQAHEAELRAAGIVRLAVFGSMARNQAHEYSDVDLLAAFDAAQHVLLIDIIRLERWLSDLVGHPVDLQEEGSFRPQMQARVEQDLVRAF